MTRPLIMIMVAVIGLTAGCEREKRRFSGAPPKTNDAAVIAASDKATQTRPEPPYEDNAYALSQGKRLFTWYNCAGCHAHGGGNIGPALMDDQWLYGSEPPQIYTSIMEGRPNGMPAFRGRVPDDQAWQLTAYVRSMAGLVRSDAAPGRNDGMQTGKSEQRRKEQEMAKK
jgi:cytochrome c oxidase cbb3-type subunit 3